jgi:hypothetical protein
LTNWDGLQRCICALELEGEQHVEKLGKWPFEIGLWVGQAATPNRMGKKGDNDENSARSRTIAFLNNDRKPSPIPLEDCPWCGTKFTHNSFQLLPNTDQPIDLRISCANRRCHFRGDRSHYERFFAWHATFYRAVEATSVTPFSPRAIDRGIAAITVALARLGHSGMTAPLRAIDILQHRNQLNFVIDAIAQRAEMHDKEFDASDAETLRQKVRGRVKDLLDLWEKIAGEKINLQYQREVGEAPPLLFDPLDPELDKKPFLERRFKAQRSLRDVEPTVNLWVRNPDGFEVEEEEK